MLELLQKGKIMTDRQLRLCDEYLTDCDPAAAAKRVGMRSKTAELILRSPEARCYIQEQLMQMHSERIADAEEVIEYLTSVMRGDIDGETVTTKERLKAAELIGRRYGMFRDNVDITAAPKPVVISGEDKLEN